MPNNSIGPSFLSNSSEVGSLGESLAAEALQVQGYATHTNTKLPGSVDIEASNGTNNLLVQVKTAVSPGKPSAVSSEELRNIQGRAEEIGAIPFLAQVQLDKFGEPLQHITFEELMAMR